MKPGQSRRRLTPEETRALAANPRFNLWFGEALSSALPPARLQDFVRQITHAHFAVIQSKGTARGVTRPEQFYGFRVEEVVGIYLYKHGTGKGIWYRLKDGRVIDCLGKMSESDRSWYTDSAH